MSRKVIAARPAGGALPTRQLIYTHSRRTAPGMGWRRSLFTLTPRVRRRRESAAKQARTDPFEALADPTRRGVLDLLRERGVATAGEIAEAFPQISRPAVSRHLRVLRESGVLMAEQRGREWWYRIDAAALASNYREFFERFAPMWEDALGRLKRQVEGVADGD